MAKIGRPEGGSDTYARCVQAGEALFAARGFDATTLREVAREVGITSAAVIHHFTSKEKLYGVVLEGMANSIEEYMGDIDNDCDLTCTLDFFDKFMSWCFENPHFARFLMRELMENQSRVAKARRLHLLNLISRMVGHIKRGQEKGDLRQCDAEMFTFYVLGAITHFSAAATTVGRMLSDDLGTPESRFRRTLKDQIIVTLTPVPGVSTYPDN